MTLKTTVRESGISGAGVDHVDNHSGIPGPPKATLPTAAWIRKLPGIVILGWVVGMLLLATTGCTLDDEDRCPPGYNYLKKEMVCELIPEEETESESPTDSSTDTETSTEDPGFGLPCTEDGGECEGQFASVCVPIVFYCSGPCTWGSSGCLDNWTCCDCSVLVDEMAEGCVKDEHVDMAIAAGCTC